MVEPLDYGPVKVRKGRHKGKVGIYDDDAGRRAVVLFDSLGKGICAELPLSWLDKVEAPPEWAERFAAQHPEVTQQSGFRVRRRTPDTSR